MINKTIVIAVSTAIAVGLLGAATAARAGTDKGSESDGFVMPGSMDGVNPAYHPGIFGNSAAAKAYGFVPTVKRGHTVRHPTTQKPD
jgi:hypothetical protein